MNSLFARVGGGVIATLLLAAPVVAKPLSDLVSPEKRRAIVEQAQRLTKPSAPTPLPIDLAQPFAPPNFDQPDPEELKAQQAAAARNAALQPQVQPGPSAPGAAPAPTGDREILETIANKLEPTGTIRRGEFPVLTFGRKFVGVGGSFTFTDPKGGPDIVVELIAIEPPTYTLRYHNEEITRPIKSGKSQ